MVPPQRAPRQLYRDAIVQYEQVSGDLDTDDPTRDEANRQITILRTRMQDAAFDSIISREKNLQEFVRGLHAVAEKARHGGSSDSIAGITALIASSLKFKGTSRVISPGVKICSPTQTGGTREGG
ncbi:MAG: hypothetical protein FD189_1286 [Elusimicrobia bacterium]|nr:MAG: hypothetical protein FD154_1510 [Elusimicrobiota bacterium]KAF0155693.1 MAG: hypothetical protein FD189_1286 [Elusimicrobiota bacterium]